MESFLRKETRYLVYFLGSYWHFYSDCPLLRRILRLSWLEGTSFEKKNCNRNVVVHTSPSLHSWDYTLLLLPVTEVYWGFLQVTYTKWSIVYLYPDDSPGRWAVSMADGNSWSASVHFKHTSILMAMLTAYLNVENDHRNRYHTSNQYHDPVLLKLWIIKKKVTTYQFQ